MNTAENIMETPILEPFKDFYRDLGNADLGRLGSFYASDILFKDPVHEIKGLVEVEDYFNNLCAGLDECRFEYLDELHGEQSAYLKWSMHFRHQKLGNELHSVRGVSHLKWSEKIEYHEDFYDMGAMLYEQLPLLGPVTRWLKRRLVT